MVVSQGKQRAKKQGEERSREQDLDKSPGLRRRWVA